MAFLLGCEKVRVEFPTKTVFEGLSLGVDEGARIGIVGQNGDGKSTLLRVLSGDVEVDDGRVIRTRGVSVGMLGQSDDLRDGDTVERAVVGDRPEYEWAGDARIRDIIAGLASDIPWDAKVGTLSGGQRQALTLLMATLVTPKLLLLDEHTAALDPATADKVLELTKKIVAENHITCLMITHNMHAALELGNRTLMMDSGHIVLDISGEERANTTVDGLLDQFAKNVGRRLDNDRILLSRQEETAQ